MAFPILRLEGRSGCRLEVIHSGNATIVRKHSKNKLYNSRLMLQAFKQSSFNLAPISGFYTPQVLGSSPENAPEAWFDMAYIHGQKYSEFLERATTSEIQSLSKSFIAYFIHLFEIAQNSMVDQLVFIEKVESVHRLVVDRTDVDQSLMLKARLYLENTPAGTIPAGVCHGDFTFSNMLFGTSGICLVDFLDSFLDSPLIDYVKYRQDTFFHWSLLIDKDIPESRKSKIVQVFRFFDQEIVNAFKDNIFVNQWYDYLQVFNLMRIVPYVHQPAEIQFVQQNINLLLKTQK